MNIIKRTGLIEVHMLSHTCLMARYIRQGYHQSICKTACCDGSRLFCDGVHDNFNLFFLFPPRVYLSCLTEKLTNLHVDMSQCSCYLPNKSSCQGTVLTGGMLETHLESFQVNTSNMLMFPVFFFFVHLKKNWLKCSPSQYAGFWHEFNGGWHTVP